MKNLVLCSAILFIAFSCKNTSTVNEKNAMIESKDTVAVANEIPKIDLKDLEQSVGKMPKEINLFEKYGLYRRIEAIMGKDFVDFKTDWNEETPLKKDGEILYTTGCKAGACKANKYFLVLDVSQNNVNVYNFKYEKGRSYEENHTIIGMPFKMADEFEKMRNEQSK